MAYNNFIKNIHGNKWNFHEDNIWNLLVKTYSKKVIIFNQYIYLYKRNNKSLNTEKETKCEIINRIYRLKALIKFYKIFKKNIRDYNKLNWKLENIIESCNASLLNKEKEIKKGIINISLDFLKIFRGRDIISNRINFILNKISNNKIIIFNHPKNKTATEYFCVSSLFNYLKENSLKKIIYIDLRNKTQFDNIFNFIFPNDIIIGLDNTIFNKNFKKIINNYYNNKIVILIENCIILIYCIEF